LSSLANSFSPIFRLANVTIVRWQEIEQTYCSLLRPMLDNRPRFRTSKTVSAPVIAALHTSITRKSRSRRNLGPYLHIMTFAQISGWSSQHYDVQEISSVVPWSSFKNDQNTTLARLAQTSNDRSSQDAKNTVHSQFGKQGL